jgi:hypothetical protein
MLGLGQELLQHQGVASNTHLRNIEHCHHPEEVVDVGAHLLAAAAHTDYLDHKDLNRQLDQGK